MKRKLLLIPLFVGLLCSCSFTNSNNNNSHPDIDEETEEKDDEIVNVKCVSLDKQSLTLKVNETYKLTATISPNNATDKKISWESDNANVVSVTSGTVKALQEGNATITATTNDGHYKATCDVTVISEGSQDDPVGTTTFTINASDFGKSDIANLPATYAVNDDFELGFAKNSGDYSPGYYSAKGGSIKIYKSNTMTIKCKAGNMSKIEFTYNTEKDTSSLSFTADKGSYSNSVWTGSESIVTFTVPNDGVKGGSKAVSTIKITYSKEGAHHDPIDLGTKTIKEVKDYIALNKVDTNSADCGVDKYTTVTIKGFALAKISLIKTAKAFGLNVSEPSKIIMGDETDAIAVATKTGDGTLFNKVDNNQCKDTSRYTITGYISIYLGQPEIVVTSYEWDKSLNVGLDVSKISKANISITEFYEKATNVHYNCAGHGYGEVYTLKGLTCFYDESAGQGKDWYNFTDGTNNIRVNAYNISGATIGSVYDVTGIISLQNLSPIIVAFSIQKSQETPVNLGDFYKNATSQSINTLRTIKGSQEDTNTKYPNVINSYKQISKTTGYLCIVEEGGKLYVGVSDSYQGKYFISGKDNAKASYGVALIKNDNFWNTTEDELAKFNPYYEDYICEDNPVEIYYINRQLGYKQNSPMWEILLIPQSINY